MRVALLVLTHGGVSGGFRKYLQRLVPLLRLHPEVDRLDVFVPPQLAGAAEHTWPEGDHRRGFRALRHRLADLQPDVIFIPTARFLRAGRIPVVVMVRNMEPLEVPFEGNTIIESLKNVGRAAAARAACVRADRVIAVSRHVHDFVVNRWRIAERKVGTVCHGIDTAALQDRRPESIPSSPFLFTAGSIRPARGLEDVITALKDVPSDLRLVIAGSVDRGAEDYAARMRSLAVEQGVGHRLVWAGQLDMAAMSWCFRNAEVFVMTSRAEACPNTVLEALVNGAFSLSTDHPPMPEFFGDAATYYRARSAGDLTEKLVGMLNSSSETRQEMQERGRARASIFSWDATAQATVAELKAAIQGASS
jgi:glycosyltransferase involved in cell wall biosynthesis